MVERVLKVLLIPVLSSKRWSNASAEGCSFYQVALFYGDGFQRVLVLLLPLLTPSSINGWLRESSRYFLSLFSLLRGGRMPQLLWTLKPKFRFSSGHLNLIQSCFSCPTSVQLVLNQSYMSGRLPAGGLCRTSHRGVFNRALF